MRRQFVLGGFILAIGMIMLLQAAGLISGNVWGYLWGLLLIIIGVGILFPDRR